MPSFFAGAETPVSDAPARARSLPASRPKYATPALRFPADVDSVFAAPRPISRAPGGNRDPAAKRATRYACDGPLPRADVRYSPGTSPGPLLARRPLRRRLDHLLRGAP